MDWLHSFLAQGKSFGLTQHARKDSCFLLYRAEIVSFRAAHFISRGIFIKKNESWSHSCILGRSKPEISHELGILASRLSA